MEFRHIKIDLICNLFKGVSQSLLSFEMTGALERNLGCGMSDLSLIPHPFHKHKLSFRAKRSGGRNPHRQRSILAF
jgi:hypothetical protein